MCELTQGEAIQIAAAGWATAVKLLIAATEEATDAMLAFVEAWNKAAK